MKKGFTLIELLAVIVILAIIALIATPIILGIINDAREKANERSVELYAAAVKNGIAAYQLVEGKEVLPDTYTKETLPFEVEYDGNVECTSIIISDESKVSLEGCKVNSGTKEYSYGIEEETLVAKTCTIEKQDSSKYSVGDVVTCELSESTDKFYVIEEQPLTATTIQMLTEKNIHTTEYRQSEDAGTVTFSTTYYWQYSIEPTVAVYGDYKDAEGKQQNLAYPIVEGYVSYLNTKITAVTGSLLVYKQIHSLSCDESGLDSGIVDCTSGPTWLFTTNYWTGIAYNQYAVWSVSLEGKLGPHNYENYSFGVRPVITISTSEIQ